MLEKKVREIKWTYKTSEVKSSRAYKPSNKTRRTELGLPTIAPYSGLKLHVSARIDL